MTNPLTAQPGTVMAAIAAMESIIHNHKQGEKEKARDEKRLETIKQVLVGD